MLLQLIKSIQIGKTAPTHMKGQILKFVEATHNFLRKRIHKRNSGLTVLTKSVSDPISKWKAITVPEKMIFSQEKPYSFSSQ